MNWGRKWNALDVRIFVSILEVHLLAVLAPFHFNWAAVWIAFGIYVVTRLFGVSLSFHRDLSHRSFKLPKWLEYSFAYCGLLALQGNPIDWVRAHRYHHQVCDSETDPHSPTEGLWFRHMAWMFYSSYLVGKRGELNNVRDLEKQPFYRFLWSTYFLHPLAVLLLLYAMEGFPFIVWGMGVRLVWPYHITFLVNSAGHVWGKQAWNSGDLSKNNWLLALLMFGEGWHNNHHAFEFSARHGLEWWQLDITWCVIKFLQCIVLASDVKLPSEAQRKRKAFSNSDGTMLENIELGLQKVRPK